MNIQETEDKLIKFCEGLFLENLLSQEELKKCYIAFKTESKPSNLNQGIEDILFNNDLQNYGMSKEQAFNNIDLLLGQNKYITCKITNYQSKYVNRESTDRIKYTLFSTEETDTSMKYLYLKNLQDLDNEENTNYNDKLVKNIIFKIEKKNNDDYVIMNYYTGELLKAQTDKQIILNGTNLTDNSYFKLHKQNKYHRFESKIYPNYFIDASNPIKLSEGSRPTQFWKLEIIASDSDELDKLSNTTFSADNTRSLIQKFINQYTTSRIDYMIINAKIKFIELLQEKTKNILNKNGLIIENIRSRVNDGELKLNEEQIMRIESSIYSEVVNNEIEALEQYKIDLKLQAQQINGSIIQDNTEEVYAINAIINKSIEKTKTQINTLNDILDKVNSESKYLTSTSDKLDKNIEKQNTLNDRSYINSNFIEIQNTHNVLNYRIFIGLLITISIFSLYLGFKLINKYKQEFK